jgi:hypothetical protein
MPAANPLAALTSRVKPLNPEELMAVAQQIAGQQQGAATPQTAQAQQQQDALLIQQAKEAEQVGAAPEELKSESVPLSGGR